MKRMILAVVTLFLSLLPSMSKIVKLVGCSVRCTKFNSLS